MSMEKIDHIGIAVENIENWVGFYKDILGLQLTRSEEVKTQKVRVAFLRIGESQIELLEPTSEDSPISNFLKTRGGGIHHIAIKVDNIRKALARFHEAGVRLLDNEPRVGSHNQLVAFIHPKASGGVLIELTQEPK